MIVLTDNFSFLSEGIWKVRKIEKNEAIKYLCTEDVHRVGFREDSRSRYEQGGNRQADLSSVICTMEGAELERLNEFLGIAKDKITRRFTKSYEKFDFDDTRIVAIEIEEGKFIFFLAVQWNDTLKKKNERLIDFLKWIESEIDYMEEFRLFREEYYKRKEEALK